MSTNVKWLSVPLKEILTLENLLTRMHVQEHANGYLKTDSLCNKKYAFLKFHGENWNHVQLITANLRN